MDSYKIACIFRSFECHHLFASQAFENDAEYMHQMMHHCPVCDKTHFFRLDKIYTLTTPKRTKAFEDLCHSLNITDRDVDILSH